MQTIYPNIHCYFKKKRQKGKHIQEQNSGKWLKLSWITNKKITPTPIQFYVSLFWFSLLFWTFCFLQVGYKWFAFGLIISVQWHMVSLFSDNPLLGKFLIFSYPQNSLFHMQFHKCTLLTVTKSKFEWLLHLSKNYEKPFNTSQMQKSGRNLGWTKCLP